MKQLSTQMIRWLVWPLILGLTYAFLYLPIIILIIFSFNKVAFPYRWVGFTGAWYTQLFNSPEIWNATYNSFVVATSSALLSVGLGLLWVFYGYQAHMGRMNKIFYLNLFVPELIFAFGLLVLFTYSKVMLGLATLIVGHTILGLGYVVPLLRARFDELDTNIIEASFDLGAGVHQTFFKIVVPLLFPTVLASFLLVFIISLDDFLIAFFCAGSSVQTLSLYIFAMVRSGVSPAINALSTILLLLSSVLVFIVSLVSGRAKIW
ncbi:MAG: ABC transporter permease [Candidatus Babeliales bacterium]